MKAEKWSFNSEGLKRFRRDFKLQQKDVASLLGITSQAYQYYEYGKAAPPVRSILKLAKEYNVTTDYLLGLTDEPRPRTTDPSWTGEMIDCRDALWQALGKVDRILGGSTYGYLQNHEPAQRQAVHRADTATA